MYFRILSNDRFGRLTYLLADQDAGEAVLVDPHGQDVQLLLALLAERELRLKWVLRTHHHDGVQPAEPGHLMSLGAALVQGDALTDLALGDGAVLPFGHEVVRILATPGHTSCCLSFAWRDRLFCGDLLSVTTCPIQPQPATPELLWDSVTEKVFALPDETLLFAGHASHARAVTTVLEQRRWHPLFAGLTRDEFLTRMAALVVTQPTTFTH